MGEFLQTSIMYEATVPKKKKRWMGAYSKDEILNVLGKYIDLELYEINEDEEDVKLVIKKDVFVNNLKTFLLEQRQLMPSDETETKLLELIDTRDYEHIMGEIHATTYFDLFETDGSIGYVLEDLDTRVYFKGLCYFTEGKAWLECYYELCVYLGNLIRRSTDNPLKGSVIIHIN